MLISILLFLADNQRFQATHSGTGRLYEIPGPSRRTSCPFPRPFIAADKFDWLRGRERRMWAVRGVKALRRLVTNDDVD